MDKIYFTYEERQEMLALPEVARRAKQLDRHYTRQDLIEMVRARGDFVVHTSGSIYSLKSGIAETVAIAEYLEA